MERKELIRTIYLYLFSLIGLILITTGLVRLVDLGLKTYVFKNADQVLMYPSYPSVKMPSETNAPSAEDQAKLERDQLGFQKKQRQSDRERTAANSLAMIIVGLPLFIYHWKTVQKDKNS